MNNGIGIMNNDNTTYMLCAKNKPIHFQHFKNFYQMECIVLIIFTRGFIDIFLTIFRSNIKW